MDKLGEHIKAPVRLLRQQVGYKDFTDGGGAVGTLSLNLKLPAGALVLGWGVNVLEAFTADTTAVLIVGDTSTNDSLSENTDDVSVYTTGIKTSQSPLNCDDINANITPGYGSTAPTVKLTITGQSDWGNVVAGKLEIVVAYLDMHPGYNSLITRK